ncbi:hypothetical protein [Sphingopyxis sp. H115]|uniref:hypothetical protein n=1 Tax=Sphingopyxis sp. H115 TaxID=1759073 RepID=UPI001F2990EE|nr:hypothetical protein [Sphingopyxis sp. H115]
MKERTVAAAWFQNMIGIEILHPPRNIRGKIQRCIVTAAQLLLGLIFDEFHVASDGKNLPRTSGISNGNRETSETQETLLLPVEEEPLDVTPDSFP